MAPDVALITIIMLFVCLFVCLLFCLQVFFQPLSKTIVTCFKDDSVHAWDSHSLSYKYQLPPPYGPTPHYRCALSYSAGLLSRLHWSG